MNTNMDKIEKIAKLLTILDIEIALLKARENDETIPDIVFEIIKKVKEGLYEY